MNKTLNELHNREIELLIEIEDITKSEIFRKHNDISAKLLKTIDEELQCIRSQRSLMIINKEL